MNSTTHPNPSERELSNVRFIRIAGIGFLGVTALLLVGFFLVLRYDFETLYSGLPIEDAALIANELDRQEVRYRIEKNGTAISVPANGIEATRLAVFNAGASDQSLTGFELFNESEMGLTEFAQKIKFQRAIQGELARTIMMINGVRKARIHIAIPERSVFRNQQVKPKAAVTLISDGGLALSPTSVLGIKRLVSASVPGLSVSDVTVVDQSGVVISDLIDAAVAEPKPEPADVSQDSDPVTVDQEQITLVAEDFTLMTNAARVNDPEIELKSAAMEFVDTRIVVLAMIVLICLLFAAWFAFISRRSLDKSARDAFTSELVQALRRQDGEDAHAR